MKRLPHHVKLVQMGINQSKDNEEKSQEEEEEERMQEYHKKNVMESKKRGISRIEGTVYEISAPKRQRLDYLDLINSYGTKTGGYVTDPTSAGRILYVAGSELERSSKSSETGKSSKRTGSFGSEETRRKREVRSSSVNEFGYHSSGNRENSEKYYGTKGCGIITHECIESGGIRRS